MAGLLLAGCTGAPPQDDPSLRHGYSYEVSVAVDRQVDDLVLRIPLPSVNGSSVLGEALVNGNGHGVWPGWRVSVSSHCEPPPDGSGSGQKAVACIGPGGR